MNAKIIQLGALLILSTVHAKMGLAYNEGPDATPMPNPHYQLSRKMLPSYFTPPEMRKTYECQFNSETQLFSLKEGGFENTNKEFPARYTKQIPSALDLTKNLIAASQGKISTLDGPQDANITIYSGQFNDQSEPIVLEEFDQIIKTNHAPEAQLIVKWIDQNCDLAQKFYGHVIAEQSVIMMVYPIVEQNTFILDNGSIYQLKNRKLIQKGALPYVVLADFKSKIYTYLRNAPSTLTDLDQGKPNLIGSPTSRIYIKNTEGQMILIDQILSGHHMTSIDPSPKDIVKTIQNSTL